MDQLVDRTGIDHEVDATGFDHEVDATGFDHEVDATGFDQVVGVTGSGVVTVLGVTALIMDSSPCASAWGMTDRRSGDG